MAKKYPTDYDWWINKSSRAFRKPGATLTAFNNAFQQHKTLALCSQHDIANLDALFAAWIKSKGGTNKKINTSREPQATTLRLKIVQACEDQGIVSQCDMVGPQIGSDILDETVHEEPVRIIPKVNRSGASPLDWVNEVKDELNAFNEKNYGVLDAEAYSGDIADGKKATVIAKMNSFKGTSTAWTLGDNSLPGNTDWDEGIVRPVYNRLMGKTARITGQPGGIGVCTTFGKAAAYILTKDRPTGPLVEMVSFKGRPGVAHIYVIVGRAPIYEDNNLLPPPGEWGKQTVIVDGWLGAMGHGVIFNVANHPKKGYLKNVTAEMVREES